MLFCDPHFCLRLVVVLVQFVVHERGSRIKESLNARRHTRDMVNTSRIVLLVGAVLVLLIVATVESGGGGKGDGKRGRAADKDLTAAADEAADEQLALALQEAENKKTSNSSGGYDDAQIARDEQKKEDEKTKKPKVMPSLVKVKNSKPSDSAVRLYLYLTNIF